MVAPVASPDDQAMNALVAILLIVAIPAALAFAIRRLAGGDGVGLVELFEAVLGPFVAPAPRSRAVPEPDFVPWRLETPRTPRNVTPRLAVLPSGEDLSTAA
jgi:hypothetical protein